MNKNQLLWVLFVPLSVAFIHSAASFCNPGWLYDNGHCYNVPNLTLDMRLARQYCEIFDADLAHVSNNSSFIQLLQLDSSSSYWIKEDSETNPKISTEDCLYYSQGVSSKECSESHHFICEARVESTTEVCPGSWMKFNSTCYKEMEPAGSYLNAVTLCTLQKGQLAVLDEPSKEKHGIAAMMGQRGITIVGARLKDSVFLWSNGRKFNPSCDTCFHQSDQEGECLGFTNYLHPVFINWFSIDCNGTYSFLCEMPATPSPTTEEPPTTAALPLLCPIGYNWKAFGRSPYCFWETTYESDRLNWFQARKFCQAYGGDLASYKDVDEELHGLGGARGHYKGLWIGLERGKDDIFRWVDGTDLVYTNWNYGEPRLESKNKYCVFHAGGTDKWGLDYCGLRRWFVCRAPKVQNPILPTTTGIGAPTTKCNISSSSIYNQWYLFNDHCYLVHEHASYSWDMAVNFCKDNEGHLASIHSFEETDFILLLVTLASNIDFWIGLSSRNLESSFTWLDGTPEDFFYWSENSEQNKTQTMDSCASFNRQRGYWTAEHCNRFLGVICKRGINSNFDYPTPEPTVALTGNCESGWYNLGNQCYKLFGQRYSQRQTWQSALDVCKEEDGNLASIHNADQQEFLADMILDIEREAWVGLRNKNRGSVFQWSDDSPLDYTYWKYYTPTVTEEMRSCVVLNYGSTNVGPWLDVTCTEKRAFICQKPKDSRITQPSENPFECSNITGWGKLGKSCYGIFSKKLSWIEAQAECRTFGADLISFKNSAAAFFLKKRIANKGLFFWIGVRETNDRKYALLNGRRISYSKWLDFQPRRVSSPLNNCVVINNETKWIVKECQESNSFICELRPEEEKAEEIVLEPQLCPNISDWKDLGGEACYLMLSFTQLSWNDAMAFCFVHGGNLASFHSEKEMSLAMDYIKVNFDHSAVHIGLARRRDNSFAWVDNSPVDFSAWESEETASPSRGLRRCVQMGVQTGTWETIDCDDVLRNFVCSVPKYKDSNSEKLTTDNQDQDTGVEKKLAFGGIFGIVICLAVVLAIIGVTVYYLCPRKNQLTVELIDQDATL